MIGWLLRRRIAAFERQWNYDAGYMHEVLDADPRALNMFGRAIGLGRYRRDVPPAPHYAAKIVGLMAEDCGPCTQLTIDMAEREGVDPAVLRAIVSRDFAAMPDDVVLAVRFAEAVLRRAPEADDLREQVVQRWGKRAVVSLAFGLLASRLYPPLKYALGHGQSCRRLQIGGKPWQAPPQVVEQAA